MHLLTPLPKISVAIKLYQRRECLGVLVSLAEGGVASEGWVDAGCRAQGAGQDLTSSPSQGVTEAASHGSYAPQPVLSGVQPPLGFYLQSQKVFTS